MNASSTFNTTLPLDVILEADQNTMKTCNPKIPWRFPKQFANGTVFQEVLPLNISLKCSLKGNIEEFIVIINDLNLFKDLSGNPLSNNILKIKSIRYVYVSDTQQKAMEGAGTSFSLGSILTFVSALGIILFQ